MERKEELKKEIKELIVKIRRTDIGDRDKLSEYCIPLTRLTKEYKELTGEYYGPKRW